MRQGILWTVMVLAGAAMVTAAWAQTDAEEAAPEAGASEGAAAQTDAGDISFDEPADKYSYGMGVQVGTQLRRFPLDINMDALTQGLEDTVAGNDLALSQQELQQAMQSLQEKLKAMQPQQPAQPQGGAQGGQQLTPEQRQRLQEQLQKRLQQQQQQQGQ